MTLQDTERSGAGRAQALGFESVSFSYEAGRWVLRGLDLSVWAGDRLAVLGRSGSGKSTIIRLLLGLEQPGSGRVLLERKVASDEKGIQIPPWQRGLAVVFQDLALWPHMTVRGQLRFSLSRLGLEREERDRRIEEALSGVSLTSQQDKYPAELSGGERQRVAIARALVQEPRAILLDEPLANLDLVLRDELLDLFVTLFEKRGTTVVHVTHDPTEALRVGTRLAVLDRGSIVYDGEGLPEESEDPFLSRLVELTRQGR